MAQNIQEVMTPNPFLVGVEAPVTEAARMMRSADVGGLIVLEEGAVCGIVTDRDITIRAVAEERDPRTTLVGEVCSRQPLTLFRRRHDRAGHRADAEPFHTPTVGA